MTVHVVLVGVAILLIVRIPVRLRLLLRLLLLLAAVVIILTASIIKHGSIGAVTVLVRRHLIHVVISILGILLVVGSRSGISIGIATVVSLAAHMLRVLILMTRDVGCRSVLTTALRVMLAVALLGACRSILGLRFLA